MEDEVLLNSKINFYKQLTLINIVLIIFWQNFIKNSLKNLYYMKVFTELSQFNFELIDNDLPKGLQAV
ncbi:hypothetical protein BpHYR1_001678 [Brachionus plicatilis]|uniref:Uncharacterized protein n=1 Tax=Brachionus plicatilis TaxID=10195 RepID=A0A3M7SP11_BRAPC|nr:hypothetical protein BpHYR1_001678 [Brachionus plicatilis]